MTRKPLWACWLSCALLAAACGGGAGRSTAPPPPPPSTPALPVLVNFTDSSVTVSWTASSDTGGPGIGGYYVFRNGNTTLPIAIVTSGTSYMDAILIPGTAYTYEVAAFDRSAPNPVVSGLSGTLSVTTSGVRPTNVLPVSVDTGPVALTNSNQLAANTLYATVTVCTPGNSNACQQIDHVQVDTGSVGLQIMAEVLNGAAALSALTDAGSNNPLRECVQFADGYVWGSMVVADVQIGGHTLASLPVHLIGDTQAGAAPADCVLGPLVNRVTVFGANGVLGVGNFLYDCGMACVNVVQAASYYQCVASSCTPVTAALDHQLRNPVAALAADNNGVVISLPTVTPPSALSATGVLYFGVGTQPNNTPGAGVSFLTVDNNGALLTSYTGHALAAGSVIDSGSNGYFFASSVISVCTHSFDSSFYCPAMSTPVTGSIIQGVTGPATKSVDFTVDSADQLFTVSAAAFPNLAGPNSAPGLPTGSFDWGLPFFYNRSVYVLFENGMAGGTNGPAVGF